MKKRIILLGILFLIGSIIPAHAVDKYWVGGDGSWNDPANWSLTEGGPGGAGVPATEDSVYLKQFDNVDRIINIDSSLYVYEANKYLTIDATGNGDMTLNATAKLNIFDYVDLGYSGKGNILISEGGLLDVSSGIRIGVNSESSGNLTLENGSFHANGGLFVGKEGSGTVIQTANTDAFALFTEIGSKGSYYMQGGSFRMETLNVSEGGYFKQDGGYFWSENPTQIWGTYDLTGGIFEEYNYTYVADTGAFNWSGGDLASYGMINNEGEFNISGNDTKVINTEVRNTGIVKTTNTTVKYNMTFYNDGAYISDPSDQYFQDLVVGESGYLIGQHLDNFYIEGDFINQSAMNWEWMTGHSNLAFLEGEDAYHDFYLAGDDYGAIMSAYSDNYAWGNLDVTDNWITLLDGNEDLGGALYVREIAGLDITGNYILNITGADGYNIYYDNHLQSNRYLNNMTYALAGGGYLIPVPEPSTLILLGVGLAGLAIVRKRFQA